MAVRNTGLLTLKDASKTMKLGNRVVAEVLLESNPMTKDAPYQVMNEGVRHIEPLRSDLPEVYYRKANQAIPPSKSTIENREFQAAHFESKSQMDETVAELGGKQNIPLNRQNQADAHIQAMGNELADLFVYGSPVQSHLKVPGLADILSSLNAAEPTSRQIVDAGGTGSDNTSAWLIYWGANTVFCVYPAGTESGIQRKDEGRVKILAKTATGEQGDIWGYEERFMVDHGLVVKDYRGLARVANIDVSDLTTVSAADLLKFMTRAHYKIPASIREAMKGKGVWYFNSTIAAILHEQALAKVSAGAGLTYANYQGEQVLYFLGNRVHEMDNILNTEARVVV